MKLQKRSVEERPLLIKLYLDLPDDLLTRLTRPQGNCLHEIFFDTALSRAKELDKYYIEHKRPWGPLHGLPISLKDVFHVKGIDTFMGYAGWIGGQGGRADGKKDKESEIVRILYQLGAILYCKVRSLQMADFRPRLTIKKTSCPQTLAVRHW